MIKDKNGFFFKAPPLQPLFLTQLVGWGIYREMTWEMDKQLPIYNKLIKFESMERKHGGQIHSRSQVG